jgi:hypothetical protein
MSLEDGEPINHEIKEKISLEKQLELLQDAQGKIVIPQKKVQEALDIRQYIERKFPTDQQLIRLREMLPKETWTKRLSQRLGF